MPTLEACITWQFRAASCCGSQCAGAMLRACVQLPDRSPRNGVIDPVGTGLVDDLGKGGRQHLRHGSFQIDGLLGRDVCFPVEPLPTAWIDLIEPVIPTDFDPHPLPPRIEFVRQHRDHERHRERQRIRGIASSPAIAVEEREPAAQDLAHDPAVGDSNRDAGHIGSSLAAFTTASMSPGATSSLDGGGWSSALTDNGGLRAERVRRTSPTSARDLPCPTATMHYRPNRKTDEHLPPDRFQRSGKFGNDHPPAAMAAGDRLSGCAGRVSGIMPSSQALIWSARYFE